MNEFENSLMIKDSGYEETIENPTIEVIELVCQNTPDFTHGTQLPW